ncbi:glutaminyl-peptide cyclotransferase [Altibacter sp.]|uniref:glutaminyl-peptide cyclotransferase n=1 Tax=Altibacter sp. TaxID=2024823 RepID=UPI000C903D09|nr:glutaminyl-peptide cyclotransferase [Altibacter sp.]MAP54079.1 glutamine cyclotransferase [Altibacter sp.]
MKFHKYFIVMLLAAFVSGCGDTSENANDLFSIQIKENKKVYTPAETISVSLQNIKNRDISSVTYLLDDDVIASVEGTAPVSVSLSEKKLGQRNLKARIESNGSTYSVTKIFTMVASEKPKLYTYKILERYPHDRDAYTQGLEFENDTLYESTGQYKSSSLRKTNYTTGEVLEQVPLPETYFGEGLTILNDKIYQLTWQENTGFIYNLATLEKKGTFVYGASKEGWGLCNDGTNIYKSDGTEKIWTLSPETLGEEGYIEIYTNTSKIPRVNELEWVEGKIYANIYQQSAIAIVNPTNGAVEGVINLSNLKDEVTQHDKLDVLNGIAYKGEPNILYVTGKNWDQLFKIEIIEK